MATENPNCPLLSIAWGVCKKGCGQNQILGEGVA